MKLKHALFPAMLWLATVPAPAQPVAAETEQLKTDLIGRTMGGRERCWMFRSRDQIKELTVRDRSEDATKRLLVVTLRLRADPDCGTFVATARLEYTRQGGVWKLQQVGLLSLVKAE